MESSLLCTCSTAVHLTIFLHTPSTMESLLPCWKPTFSQSLIATCWKLLCLSWNIDFLAQKSSVSHAIFPDSVFSAPNKTSMSPVSRSRKHWGRRVRNCWSRGMAMTVTKVCLVDMTGSWQSSTPSSCDFLHKMELVNIPSLSDRRLHHSTRSYWQLIAARKRELIFFSDLFTGKCPALQKYNPATHTLLHPYMYPNNPN